MFGKYNKAFIVSILAITLGAACSSGAGEKVSNASNANANAAEPRKPAATPSNQVTEADVAKLKWLEGTWRGMDGDKPFYERIRFEGSTMIVETFENEMVSEVKDASRFELKNGEFGHSTDNQRSAVSTITENSVQFVPAPPQPGAPPKGHTFRFERQNDGKWKAILETPSSNMRPAEKVYVMEPWKAPAR